jgi:ATP-dependent DNA helicase RecG
MKPQEKDAIFQDFASGRVRCLVSTTVIEVGVDVRDATLMIIEHAERFGLAQLHQLRGRVGRGEAPSTCLLLYAPPLSPIATERLSIMRETQDGFVIAEKDLQLRGAGDVLGTKQSGLMAFRNADPTLHADLLMEAQAAASHLVESDPSLSTPAGLNAQRLMTLYGAIYELPEAGSSAPVGA